MEPQNTDLSAELISSGPTPAQQLRGTALLCAATVWEGCGTTMTAQAFNEGAIIAQAHQFEAYLRGDDPDAAPAPAEVDPVEMPTGLGAVLRAKRDDESTSRLWVRAERGDIGWISADGECAWADLARLTDVTVLHPGIEVELP